ncbi:hypothetical protein BV20DRAFT_715972 [Pilatotrama ljubarskyi]|nr:hypothetical protein BV20DRAFT_715972 [Pilatotrama ljubarskyi]
MSPTAAAPCSLASRLGDQSIFMFVLPASPSDARARTPHWSVALAGSPSRILGIRESRPLSLIYLCSTGGLIPRCSRYNDAPRMRPSTPCLSSREAPSLGLNRPLSPRCSDLSRLASHPSITALRRARSKVRGAALEQARTRSWAASKGSRPLAQPRLFSWTSPPRTSLRQVSPCSVEASCVRAPTRASSVSLCARLGAPYLPGVALLRLVPALAPTSCVHFLRPISEGKAMLRRGRYSVGQPGARKEGRGARGPDLHCFPMAAPRAGGLFPTMQT